VAAVRINPYRRFPGVLLPTWLLRQRDVSLGAKMAYGRLMAFAGVDGEAFPSMATLGAELGVSDRQARSYVAELKAHHLIEQVDDPSRRKSSRYYFLEHPWMAETGQSGAEGSFPPEVPIPSAQPGSPLPPRAEESFPPDRKDPSAKGIQGRDSAEGVRVDAPNAGAREGGLPRLATVERPAAVNGLDACADLRAASDGALPMSASGAMAVAFGEVLTTLQAQHKRNDLVPLLGAYAVAGGFRWMTQRKPSVPWFLEREGAALVEAVESAVAWDREGRPPVLPRAPARNVVVDARRGAGRVPATERAEFQRYAAAVGCEGATAIDLDFDGNPIGDKR
jgi:hypothetical protein